MKIETIKKFGLLILLDKVFLLLVGKMKKSFPDITLITNNITFWLYTAYNIVIFGVEKIMCQACLFLVKIDCF